MSTISSITPAALDRATVGLSATPDSAAVDQWRVVAVTAGAVASDVYHVARTGASCQVYFSPPLSPGASYTLSTTTTTGGIGTSSSLGFAAPSAAKPLGEEWSHGVLRAWSRAIAQTVQEFVGVPTTVLTQDIQPAETSIYVETTLGFPLVGYVFVGGARYRYQGRGPAAFHDVTPDEPATRTQPRRQVVYLDTSSVWPPEGTRYLTTTGREYTDPNGVF